MIFMLQRIGLVWHEALPIEQGAVAAVQVNDFQAVVLFKECDMMP